ncbi:MAG TPA: alpha/beta hydrolase-fold protein [Anaerolineales bacterium]|nr:alpha/beta hydrolase-fold protein [Anaerolineales bacterium]
MTESIAQYPQVPIANSQLRHIKSSIVGREYQVKIRLPEDYANTTKLYPVLYLLDGDHAFAMATDIVQYLIYGQHIPDLIIASPAYNSKKLPNEGGKNMRDHDLIFWPTPYNDMTPGAAPYLEFFQQELIPFVESNYRVVPNDRTLWGYSSGGVFALFALFEKPHLFQRYVIVDGFDDIFLKIEEAYAKQHEDLSARVCISAPPSDLDSKKLFDLLKAQKFPSFRAEFAQLNNLGHFAISAEGLTKGLVSVFGN